MRASVPPDLDRRRADLVVSRLAGLSRAAARRAVESGSATFDGATAAPSERVRAGMVLDVDLPAPRVLLVPEPVPFVVRHEDGDVAVVDKPAGVVVHPGAGAQEGTLAAGLLHRWPQIEGVGDPGRWGIVHRLDRDTSGLLAVALSERALGPLRAAIAGRRVRRGYRALVIGEPPAATGTVDAPLDRDPAHRGRVAVRRGGRPARTHYSRLAVWSGHGVTLLEVRLETGRTHQIRVHLAAAGLPVAGDLRYGRRGGPSPRLFLHAAELAFDHPVTGDGIHVVSALPADLQAVVDGLGPPDVGSVR